MRNQKEERVWLENYIIQAFQSVPKPKGWPERVGEMSTFDDCNKGRRVVSMAQPEYAIFALPRVMVCALNYDSEDIVADLILTLDIGIAAEDESDRPSRQERFSKFSAEQRKAVSAWLEYVERWCAPPAQLTPLNSARSYWSK